MRTLSWSERRGPGTARGSLRTDHKRGVQGGDQRADVDGRERQALWREQRARKRDRSRQERKAAYGVHTRTGQASEGKRAGEG